MNLGGGTRTQTILAAVLGLAALVACGFIYEELFATGPANPAAVAAQANSSAGSDASVGTTSPATTSAPAVRPVAVGTPARRMAGSSAALDPTLHMDAMLASEQVEYSGVGRNIFSPNSEPPVVIPQPIAAARPGPMIPQAPVRMGPPPLPPIDLTFFGTETDAAGRRQAILLHEDTVYTAEAGDIVLRRYRVISVDARSMLVEDLQNNNRQTLPLVAN